MKKLIHRFVLLFLSCLLFSCFLLILFMPIFTTNALIFPYAITPFDICKQYPDLWILLKKLYWICFFISYFIVYNFLYNNIQKYFQIKKNKLAFNKTYSTSLSKNSLNLLVGNNFLGDPIYIPEKGLYQNILITGTIGSRKNFFGNVSIY